MPNASTPLRLLSWNVKMLPPIAKIAIPPFGLPVGWWEMGSEGIGDLDRAKQIGKLLAKGDWDVIVLQEVFDEAARAVIRKALERKGGCNKARPQAPRRRRLSWRGAPGECRPGCRSSRPRR